MCEPRTRAGMGPCRGASSAGTVGSPAGVGCHVLEPQAAFVGFCVVWTAGGASGSRGPGGPAAFVLRCGFWAGKGQRPPFSALTVDSGNSVAGICGDPSGRGTKS